MIRRIMQNRTLTTLLGCLVLLTSLAGCGGGGGDTSGQMPPPPPLPPGTPGSAVLVTGRAHAGTPARPLAQAPCRFVGQDEGLPLAEATTNEAGVFALHIPLEQQGFILCHPATIPSLTLTAFISTVGQTVGGGLSNEEVTPASSVIADVIRANNPVDPQAEKEALLAALARAEADITTLVEAATLLYQTLVDAQTGSDADFSGISAEGGDSAEADGGGAEGEAGDGGEFSPLPGALCTFSLDAAGLVRTNTMLGDLYANGRIDRLDLQAVAAPINNAMDAERRRAIAKAFAALFPLGIGPYLATIADGANSVAPGRYFLPIPAGVPGVVTCIPDTLDNLVLHTCVRARLPHEVLDTEDVTPISTVLCEIANEVQQADITADRETIKLDLLDRLAPLRIFLSEDRNGNGVQDTDETDKNGDGEFATIAKLEVDEPLTENNRNLALLASMATTIFDTLRIEIDNLELNPSFELARHDFFTDSAFDMPFEPIALGVESALNDPENQGVLGTDDIVTAATTGTLRGRVTDVRGQPVDAVRVLVSQDGVDVAVPNNPAITDGDGRFQIQNIPVGDTVVRAFLGEFEVLRVTTNVVAVVMVDLEIAPTSKLESHPADLVFDDVEVGATRVLMVRLVNQGLADVTISGLVIEGAGASAFRFNRRPALPVVVATGSEVTVAISYEPTEVSTSLATLRVESDATHAPVLAVPLIGTGVVQPVPQIELSHTQFTFGEVQLNASQTQSMVVRNSGTAPLTIGAVTLETDSGSGFMIEHLPALPTILPPDGELALRVRFQPTRPGVSRGVVRIQSNADATPNRTVALSGTGVEVPVPEIMANPSAIEFGEVQIHVPGEESSLVTRPVTVRNTGTADLILTAIRVDSSQGNEFQLLRPPTLPLTIIPGGGVTLDVQYRPTILGSVTGAVRIRSNTVHLEDLTIALSGTGVDTRVPKLAVSQSTLDYGAVEIGAIRQLSVDVTNTGTGDLDITSLALQSPEGQVFQLNRPPETPFTLVPGATQRLYVQFQPHAGGYASGALRIHNNDTERPRHLISLRGEGVQVPMPQMVVSPEEGSFGDVQVGSSRAMVLTISNPGLAALEVTAFEGSVLSGGDFELRRPPSLPVRVRPRAEVAIEVVFRPQQVGSVSGTLQIRGTAPDTPEFTVSLYGTAILEPSPAMQVHPPTLDYGEVQVSTSQTQPVTIENRGTANLVIRTLSITDQSSRDFEIERAPQLPVTVIPGSNVQVHVRYAPSLPGVASGALSIVGNDPDQPVATVSLNGIGMLEPTPQIDVAPAIVAFSEVAIGASRVEKVTIRNTGTDALVVTALDIDGGEDDEFRVQHAPTLPVTVLPEGAIEVDLAYMPVTVGSATATLNIASNDPKTPAVIRPLNGVGVPMPTPQVAASTAALSFAEVEVGSRRERTVIVTNVGNAPLTIREISVEAEPEGVFSLAGELTVAGVPTEEISVAPRSEVPIGVVFAPTSVGSVTGTLQLMSNAANVEVLTVSLNGIGTEAPMPALTASPSVIDFGEVEIGQTRTLMVSMLNEGSKNLTISNLMLMAADGTSFALGTIPVLPAVVPPATTVNAEIRFVPTTEGSATGTFHIVSDDPENPETVLQVNGEALSESVAQLKVSPSPMSFGEVRVGTTATLPLSIANEGSADLNVTGLTVNGGPNNVFRLGSGQQAALTVAPGGVETVDIIFAPIDVGLMTGTVGIQSNASNASEMTVSLRGMGTNTAPEITLSPAAMNFSGVPVGSNRTMTVTAMNTGTADLAISAITIEGAGFTLGAGATPTVLQPNGMLAFDVIFQPNSPGAASGVVRVSNNTIDSPQVEIPLSGTGTVPEIAVVPEAVDFGGVILAQSEMVTVTLTNAGTADLDISSVTAEGAAFSASGVPAGTTTLSPGESLAVDVTFAPLEPGEANGVLQILSNAPTSPTQVPLRGNGLAIPAEIEVSPAALGFGTVSLDASVERVLTIRNPSEGELSITDIRIGTGADAGFALSELFAGPVEVAPGGAFTVTVVFTPLAAGEVDGSVEIESNAEAGLVTIPLSGVGEAVPTARLVVAPEAIDYGEVPLSDTQIQELTLRNEGDAALSVNAIALTTGADVGFALVDAPSAAFEIVPGGEFVVGVELTPTVEGALTGNLQITSDSVDGSPTDVPLSGVGVAQPMALIEVEPADEVAFGNVEVEQTRTVSVTITNSGDADLTLDSVSVSEGAEVGFALAGDPLEGVVLAPTDTLEVSVTFTPVAEGLVTGLLQIESDAANEPVLERPLSGTGTAIPVPVVTVTPAQVNFGEVVVGSQATVEVQIANTGDADLTVEEVLIAEGAASGFSVTGVPAMPTVLAPGQVQTVSAVFAPVAPGAVTATLSVLSNASNGAEQLIALQGSGEGVPELAVLPLSIDFGNVLVGSRGTAEVQIDNTGTATLNVASLVISGETGAFAVGDGSTGPFTLEPGENMAVSISFSPSQAGEARATLAIDSNANETPRATVALRGAGVVALIDVQPSSLIFDAQEIGQSQTLSIQVVNNGTGTLDLTSVSVDDPSFVLGGVPESVAPGASETIEVTFMPNRDGDILGELVIANNSQNAPQVVVSLSGSGTVPAGAGILVGPTILTFDDTAIHESVSLSVTASSVGLADVTLTGLALGGAGGFVLGESPSLPITLAPGEAYTIAVVFAPDAPGAFADQLQLTSDDENNPVTNITLNGTGVATIVAPDEQP